MTDHIRTGMKVYLDRKLRAFDNFAAMLAEAAPGIDGNKTAAFYITKKLVKYDGDRYTVKHGALWDVDVIRRVAEAATR